MQKSIKEIADKVQEIFALSRDSITPLNVLCLQCTILLGRDDWPPIDVERVSGDVMDMLIKHGWTKAGA